MLLGHFQSNFVFPPKYSKNEYEIKIVLTPLHFPLHYGVYSINKIIYFFFVHYSIME